MLSMEYSFCVLEKNVLGSVFCFLLCKDNGNNTLFFVFVLVVVIVMVKAMIQVMEKMKLSQVIDCK